MSKIKVFHRHIFLNPNTRKVVNLYSVRHIAIKEDYEKMNELLQKDVDSGAVVHTEGVKNTPPDRTLQDLYKRMADDSSMVGQYYTVPVENHDIEYKDLSILAKLTMSIMSKIIKFALNFEDKHPDPNGKKIFTFDEEKMDNNSKKNPFLIYISNVFGGKREKIAIRAAMDAFETHDEVSMVWGAAHAHSFEKRLKQLGFLYIFEKNFKQERRIPVDVDA